MTSTRSGPSATVGTSAPDATMLPRLLSTAADPSLDAHLRQWGPAPAGAMSIQEIERSGLRGRGGASFPTAQKLATVASAGRAVVVANGTEGEPASAKDKTLLTRAPHLVLDGISLAAQTVGAEEAYLCVDREATRVVRILGRAAAERAASGIDTLPVRIEAAPSRYLTGEESSLVHWLNGGEAKPTFVPPRPFQKGVRGRPTLVNNVETLANLALIGRFGAPWFRRLGTADDPGSLIVTVAGDVAKPGVYEVPFGSSIDQILRSTRADPGAHSLLIGGYAGTWVPLPAGAGLSLDRKSLGSAGAVLGCASLLVLGGRSCGLAATARIAGWMAGQSAGQCGPCTNGLPAIADALDALVAGDRRGHWEKQLKRWLELVEGRGACHHPDGVARMVRSAMRVFAKEMANHRHHGDCRAPAPALLLPEWHGAWR